MNLMSDTNNSENNAPELYRKYRPKNFSEVLGQDDAINMIKSWGKSGKIPHCLMLTGPSGCGKTTIARILKDKLNCSDMDFNELNCAGDARGIDTIRSIDERMNMMAIGGDTRIWLLDEAGKLTNDAQTALLKMCEEPPNHVYFFLATTDPQKIIPTIKTRASEIKVKLLTEKSMQQLLTNVLEAEEKKLSTEIQEKIVEVAEGSPRKALVLLGQVIGLQDEKEQLAVVMANGSTVAIDIARALSKGKKFSEIAKMLKVCEDEPETTRRVILGYFSAILLNSGTSFAYNMACCFERNFYDSGKSGLAIACYEATLKGKNKGGDKEDGD